MSNMVYPQSSNYPSSIFERTTASGQNGQQVPDTMRTQVGGHREGRSSSSTYQQSVIFYPPIVTVPQKKEIDELARKQEEFILRCQYPKRILPGELVCDLKKSHYVERRRERSASPLEARRKACRHQPYRSYSKSPSRLWRQPRREADRSESPRSPRRHTDFTPPGARSSPTIQTEPTSASPQNRK